MTQDGYDAYTPMEPLAGPQRGGRGNGPVVALVVALVLVAGAVGALFLGGAATKESGVSVVTAEVGARCGPMQDRPVPGDGAVHREGPIAYEPAPPVGGEHNPMPLPAMTQTIRREAAPPNVTERAVHNLEHGYVVVWYDGRATEEQLDAVTTSAREAFLRKVLVVPWSHGSFDGPSFVLTAWGHLQACELPDTAAIKAFWTAHGGPNGEAPEAAAP